MALSLDPCHEPVGIPREHGARRHPPSILPRRCRLIWSPRSLVQLPLSEQEPLHGSSRAGDGSHWRVVANNKSSVPPGPRTTYLSKIPDGTARVARRSVERPEVTSDIAR
eukprot:scaffold5369_cov115-Isochrysis_galbana.AAC.1